MQIPFLPHGLHQAECAGAFFDESALAWLIRRGDRALRRGVQGKVSLFLRRQRVSAFDTIRLAGANGRAGAGYPLDGDAVTGEEPSFAQFERELISERTRDKMCAARRKGKWIGGHPVLGYDIDTKARRLLVNPDEAHQVRTIFDQYLELGGMLPVLQDLDRRGWQTKRWTTEAGQTRGGKPFTKSLLYGLLTNAIYTGQVNHKGTLFPGEHEAIIENSLWDEVQRKLEEGARAKGNRGRRGYRTLRVPESVLRRVIRRMTIAA